MKTLTLPAMQQQPKEKGPHGLNTLQDLSWVGRMRLALRRQSRKLYRSIRHPKQRRKGRVRDWLGARIHNRNLWRFRRHSVAGGIAGGLFVGMLPIPGQSAVAGILGIARGWNLPAAVAATWVSFPLTYWPMFLGAKYSVMWIYGLFGAEPAIRSLKLTPSALKEMDWATLKYLVAHAGPELLLGYLILAIVSAAVGWVLVHSLWWLVKHHEEPHNHAREKHRTAREARAAGRVN